MEMTKDEYTYGGWASGLNRNTLSKKKERVKGYCKGSIYKGGIRVIGGKITAHAIA